MAAYLPQRDQDLAAWADNFAARISATPAAYGLSAPDAADFLALAVDFAARLTTAVNPATRTMVSIQEKDISRAVLRTRARGLARLVNAHPTITNAQRAELGLSVRQSGPRPIPVPVTQPVVRIEGSSGGQSFLRIADETSPHRRAKPPGVFGAIIYGKIGPATAGAPVTIDEAKFLGVATRTLHSVDLPAGSAGQTLWIMAQWMNERGQPGPTSVGASAMIAA